MSTVTANIHISKMFLEDLDKIPKEHLERMIAQVTKEIRADLLTATFSGRVVEGQQQPARCFGNQHYFPIGATTCICGKVQTE